MPEQETQASLRRDLDVYQQELTSITDKIREVRQEARNESIRRRKLVAAYHRGKKERFHA
jgi:hypothetical protein